MRCLGWPDKQQGENMENEDHGGKQDQLEKHTLPGTNQAGKGPGSCEKNYQREQTRR
jgi:hypothetical protein